MNSKPEWRKRELPLFTAVALLVLLVVVDLSITHELTAKDIGAAFLSLLGTFIGAFLAFRLQKVKDAELEENSRVDAINRALIVMIFQYNHLATTNRTLDQYQGKLPRMINLPPERDADQFDLRQNVETLAFFANVGHANLIMQIAIEQGRFDAARQALNERCRILVDEVQPAMERHDLNNRPFSENVLREAFGDRLFGALETATNEVYRHVPLTLESLTELIDEVHGVAKQLYPHRIILKMIPN